MISRRLGRARLSRPMRNRRAPTRIAIQVATDQHQNDPATSHHGERVEVDAGAKHDDRARGERQPRHHARDRCRAARADQDRHHHHRQRRRQRPDHRQLLRLAHVRAERAGAEHQAAEEQERDQEERKRQGQRQPRHLHLRRQEQRHACRAPSATGSSSTPQSAAVRRRRGRAACRRESRSGLAEREQTSTTLFSFSVAVPCIR